MTGALQMTYPSPNLGLRLGAEAADHANCTQARERCLSLSAQVTLDAWHPSWTIWWLTCCNFKGFGN
eukprot:4708439-Amphidinium_carterae.1